MCKSKNGDAALIGDGNCDEKNNNEWCEFDGLDCDCKSFLFFVSVNLVVCMTNVILDLLI